MRSRRSKARTSLGRWLALPALVLPIVFYALFAAGLLDAGDLPVFAVLAATAAILPGLRRRQPYGAILIGTAVSLGLILFFGIGAVSAVGSLDEHVVVEGDRAWFVEPITPASPVMLRKVLQRNPQVRRIELGGVGGNATAGVQMARLVRERGLETSTARDQLCESACTYAFWGGHTRHAAAGCPLRFHAEDFAVPAIARTMTWIHHRVLDLPPLLAARIAAAPSQGALLQIPSAELQQQEGFVTDLDPNLPAVACGAGT
jgi:hypothetical protein